MPRGQHPNSRANLTKAYGGKGGFDTETARIAKKKSDEAKAVYRSLNADLREQCTPEVIAEINKRLLQMAKHGNLKAYELLRDGIGEKPTETHDINVSRSHKLDDVFSQMGGEGLEE